MNESQMGHHVNKFRDQIERIVTRIERVIFGDRWGVLVFLLGVVASATLWRVGIFITDTYTVANAFVALTEGNLGVERAVYGRTLATPGMHVVDGTLYGRNYGQLFLSLPAYWVLSGLSALVDPRILLAGGYSLSILATGMVAGSLFERGQSITKAGSLLGSLIFLGCVAVATDFDRVNMPLAALQVTNIIGGAMIGVVLYRLLARLYTTRTGFAGGMFAIVGTPVLLWAPMPKRHIFTTLFPLAAFATLAISRMDDTSRSRGVHALAYAFVGATVWIHAAEGLLLCLVLGFVDVVTGEVHYRPNRTTATVLIVLVVALVPFFATNLAISGNPVQSPRELPTYEGQNLDEPGSEPIDSTVEGDGIDNKENANMVRTGLYAAISPLGRLATEWSKGIDWMVSDPTRVFHTFVRSGYLADVAGPDGGKAINMTVLESMPLLGGLLSIPVLVIQRFHNRSIEVKTWLQRPVGTADAGLGLYAVLLTLLYISRLPLHAQLTVRYLLPVFPIGVYMLLRYRPVRKSIEDNPELIVATWTGVVLIGSQLLVLAVSGLELGVGEAIQLHALIGIISGAILGGGALWSTVSDSENCIRTVAVSLGLATAVTTVLVCMVSVGYTDQLGKYPSGGAHALDVVRVLAEILALA